MLMRSQRPAPAVGAIWLYIQHQLTPACLVFIKHAPGDIPSECLRTAGTAAVPGKVA